MSSPDPSQKAPGLLARLVQPLPGKDPAGWALGAVLALGVAVAAAWLLTPPELSQRFPGEEALGTPAPVALKAARDYELLDADATAQLREEAAAAEPTVYDLDEDAAEEAVARIRAAFQAAREVLAELPGRPPGPRPLAAAREAFEAQLGVPLREPDLAALALARFDPELEQLAAGLAAHGLTGMVIEDRERLQADAERGIVVRSLRATGNQGSRLVRDLALVRDLRGAREQVRREGAAVPPGTAPAQREAVVRVAQARLRPTLTVNMAETARAQRLAAERVKPTVIQVRRGERLVGDGERIERRHLLLFAGIQAQTRARDLWAVRLGAAALALLLVLLLWRHAAASGASPRPSRRDAVLLAVLLVGTWALSGAGLAAGDALHDRFPRIPPEAFYHLLPFAAGAMVVRSLLGADTALRFAVAAGLGVGILAGNSLFFAFEAVLSGVAASVLAPRSRDRLGLVEAGAGVGLVGALLAAAAQLFAGRLPGEALAPAGFAFLGGALLLPAAVSVLLPLAERALGYLTDVRLQELANLNHPALKDLIVQAPGTYHHSVIMGAMVEAAAEAAGANPLLARVCAYYHDVGKIRNPLYFAENQRGENRHEQLAPSMSSLIVRRHVVDGLELARRWKLPAAVQAVVAQHHGTRLVSYFLQKARKEASEGAGPWEDPAAVDDEPFRYPGPRPRTPEAALVMIADVAEASARALAEPTPERLSQLCQKRIDELLAEGQLDECTLTLRQLRQAGAAMGEALVAVYRARADEAGQGPGLPAGDGRGLHLVARR
ncbi:MAG: HDIG domain-containing protein [Deltaproteobacteria bacterium]|nr:HDIG domain-containing protein [Deltaproteobacteria bacterium]